MDLDLLTLPLALLTVVPEEVLRRLRVLPLADEAGLLTVAVPPGTRDAVMDELAMRSGRRVSALVTSDAQLQAVLDACLVGRRRGDSQWRGSRAPRGVALPLNDAIIDDVPGRPRASTPPPVAPAPAEPLAASPSAATRREPPIELPEIGGPTRRATTSALVPRSRLLGNEAPPAPTPTLPGRPATSALPASAPPAPSPFADDIDVPIYAQSASGFRTMPPGPPSQVPAGTAAVIAPSAAATSPGGESAADGFVQESSFDRTPPRSDVHGRPRPRVLVVDDDEGIRVVIRHALTQRGLEVLEADSGTAALHTIKERGPDALLLDGQLPDVHGFDVLARVRQSQRYRGLPVILVTGVYKGWRFAADLEESHGVYAVVEKPFDVRDLSQLVLDALAGRPPARRGEGIAPEAQRVYDDASQAFRDGRLGAALEQMAHAVAMDPLSALLHHQLGLLYAQNGQEFAAIAELEAALEIAPRRFVSLRNLAIIYQRRGLRRRARELWERALDAAPDEATRGEIHALLLDLL